MLHRCPGEDFQIFEQDLPGENAAGFNTARVAAGLPLETCMTINRSWGYNSRDTEYKSTERSSGPWSRRPDGGRTCS